MRYAELHLSMPAACPHSPEPVDELLETDGGDGPAWSRHRPLYEPARALRPSRRDGPVVPYAEMCSSVPAACPVPPEPVDELLETDGGGGPA